jgi:hypothetical protein
MVFLHNGFTIKYEIDRNVMLFVMNNSRFSILVCTYVRLSTVCNDTLILLRKNICSGKPKVQPAEYSILYLKQTIRRV